MINSPNDLVVTKKGSDRASGGEARGCDEGWGEVGWSHFARLAHSVAPHLFVSHLLMYDRILH